MILNEHFDRSIVIKHEIPSIYSHMKETQEGYEQHSALTPQNKTENVNNSNNESNEYHENNEAIKANDPIKDNDSKKDN